MRVSVVVTSARASVSYAVPVADVAYVELVSSARLDSTGLYTFVADSAMPGDRASRSVSKPRADSTTATDVRVCAVWKPAADSVSTTDALVATLIFMRVFSDAAAVSSAAAWAIHKPAADTSTVADLSWRAIAKAVADGVGMNDSFAMGDGALYSFSKAISNVTILSDTQRRAVTKPRADGAAVSDAGVLTIQDYCDIDYFLDDYVGESRVF